MKKTQILFVSSNDNLGFSIKLILNNTSQYEVFVVKNSFEAFNKITSLRGTDREINILISDSRLYGITIGNLIDGLKNFNIHVPVLIINLDKNKDNKTIEELAERGIHDYLESPLDSVELLEQIEKKLNIKQVI